MDPFAIYLSLFLGAVVVGVVALVVAPAVRRTCPQCGEHVPVAKRVCRHCRYRFI